MDFGKKRWDWTSWRSLALIGAAAGTAIGVLATIRPASGYVPPTGTGIIVPLYTYPGASWNAVAQVKRQYPNLPILAIINQNSGNLANGQGSPQSRDSNFASGITSLVASGVIVIAYVHCGFGSIVASDIQANMRLYNQWYPGLSGYFFDEAQNQSPAFYTGLTAYAKSTLGYRFTMGNPGTALPSSSFIGACDSWCIAEDGFNHPLSDIIARTSYGDKKNFAWISYSVPTYDATIVSASRQYVGWLYTTAGVYTTDPTYLQQMASTLSS